MHPDERTVDTTRPLRSRRTQPALPGVTQPTLPIAPPATPRFSVPQGRKTRGWRTALQLCILGLFLEALLLALYPLLAALTSADSGGQQVQRALPGLFPWLPSLYWTNVFPPLPRLLTHVPFLNILDGTTGTNALLSSLLLVLASAIALFASRVGGRVAQNRLSRFDNAFLFWLVLLLTVVFGATMLLAPVGLTVFSQDMFTYGVYGHMVAFQHANPYGVTPSAHSLLQPLVGVKTTTPYGPVWTDISVLLALVAQNSVANTLLTFRGLGLLAHVVNVALLWTILTRVKPEARLAMTLLYAWNPLILLFGVAEMHQEIVLLCVMLAALLFFQRSSPTIGWICILLVALMNLLWLPLLPLFFRLMLRQSRVLRMGHRLLWWGGMLLISLVVLVLAYAPYWHAIGFTGVVAQLHRAFLQDTAVNSLDAALLNLPVRSAWLINSQHWSLVALGIVGLFLLFGLWLADSIELVALFCCWLLLLYAVLLPVYWPWYLVAPFALALCSTNRRSIVLLLLLLAASLLSYYLLLNALWVGQALATIGLPVLIWGWVLFFSSTWQMTHVPEGEVVAAETKGRPSRPSFLSRPSRPGRRY